MKFYGHSLKNAPEERWQLLRDHLQNVAVQAAKFAESFGSEKWAFLCGLLHDLGKYSLKYQKRLRGGPKVDHSLAGALEVMEYLKGKSPLDRLMAHIISGHHTGLANGTGNTEGAATLAERLDNAAGIPDYSAWEQEVDLPGNPGKPPLGAIEPCDFPFILYLWGKMLYSCLVDADFLDTEGFMSPDKSVLRGQYPTLEKLHERIDAELAEKTAGSKANKLNGWRAKVLEDCRRAGREEQGIFTLSVPTGGGKTLSSLAFALEHAKIHKLDRIIYVIPYTSIIEQTADVFRKALGPDLAHAVVEHHCNAEAQEGSKNASQAEDQEDLRTLAWENWDAPLIVTTSVQFFESLFAARSSRCRKLHNIASSVVILDEAQTLPVPFLQPCLSALKELSRQYKVSTVLCTATQPQVDVKPWLKGGLKDVREIVENVPDLFAALKRVQVEFVGTLEDDELVGQLMRHERVLCIVNTRAHARKLCELLKEQGRAVFHLSTWMYPEHRRAVLKTIREQLGDPAKPPCTVIATSLIEAGVDISFPVVFRAMNGLDSIAQAAGRCNREWEDACGSVYVFDTPNIPRGEQQRRCGAGKKALEAFEDVLSPVAVADYFDELYSLAGESGLDKKGIMRGLAGGASKGWMPYRSVAQDFILIEDNDKPVFIATDPEAEACLAALEQAPSRELNRRMQRWCVGVPMRQWAVLLNKGIIAPRGYAGQWHVLAHKELYNDIFGLDVSDPIFVSAEEAIV